MSVYYDVIERFHLKDGSSQSAIDAVYTLLRQIADFSPYMILDDGYIEQLKLSYNGRRIEFSGSLITQELAEFLQGAICEDPESMDMFFMFHCRSDVPGLWALMDLMDEMTDDDLECFDFCALNHADCGDPPGCIAFYGARNGVVHRGGHGRTLQQDFPQGGDWYAPTNTVTMEIDYDPDTDAEVKQAMETTCRKLMAYSEYDNFESDDNRICFDLNNLRLHGQDEIAASASLIQNLLRLAGRADAQWGSDDCHSCDVMYALYDFSPETGPRTLEIEFDRNGDYQIFVEEY